MTSPQSTDPVQSFYGTTGILPESAATSILEAVAGLRYGQVTVIVQDGRVLQIDRTERFRINNSANPHTSEADTSPK